jgi:uncharacterized protein YjiS (DUF1127 family)
MFTLNHGDTSPLPFNWPPRIAPVIARYWSRIRRDRHARLMSTELQTLDDRMLNGIDLQGLVTAPCPALRIAPDLSVLGRIVLAVAPWRARARADAEARRSIFYLARLDDHTLRDIGLNRAAFYCEGTKPRWNDM